VSACLKNLITNIENDTEVMFVHALNRSRYILNNLLLVYPFLKKGGYFNFSSQLFRKFENVLWVALFIPSGTLLLVKYPVLIKPNILLLLY
jgi:hypothetical protein